MVLNILVKNKQSVNLTKVQKQQINPKEGKCYCKCRNMYSEIKRLLLKDRVSYFWE